MSIKPSLEQHALASRRSSGLFCTCSSLRQPSSDIAVHSHASRNTPQTDAKQAFWAACKIACASQLLLCSTAQVSPRNTCQRTCQSLSFSQAPAMHTADVCQQLITCRSHHRVWPKTLLCPIALHLSCKPAEALCLFRQTSMSGGPGDITGEWTSGKGMHRCCSG